MRPLIRWGSGNLEKNTVATKNYTCNHIWESRYNSWSPRIKPRKIFFSLNLSIFIFLSSNLFYLLFNLLKPSFSNPFSTNSCIGHLGPKSIHPLQLLLLLLYWIHYVFSNKEWPYIILESPFFLLLTLLYYFLFSFLLKFDLTSLILVVGSFS